MRQEINILWLEDDLTSDAHSNRKELVEEILEYIDLVSNVLKKEIFILVNFHIFLEKDDIAALYRECFYKKIKLLFAESQKPDIINEEEKLFIIDNDLCEINLS